MTLEEINSDWIETTGMAPSKNDGGRNGYY